MAFVVENILPWLLPAILLGVWIFLTPSKDIAGVPLRRKIEIFDFLPPLGLGYFVLTLISAKYLSITTAYNSAIETKEGTRVYPEFPVDLFIIYGLIGFAVCVFICGEMSEELRQGETVRSHKGRRLAGICVIGLLTIAMPWINA